MDYSTIHPEIWTGETGSKLHGDPAAQVLYAYLMTCRHRNQLGLYYLPLSYVSDDTGLSADAVTEKMAKLSSGDVGFCKYDYTRKLVWVIKMAPKQISRSPKATAGAASLLAKLPDSPLKRELVALYGSDLSRLNTLSIPYPYPIDTVSNAEQTIPYAYGIHTLSIGDPVLVPIQDQNNSGSEQGQSQPASPPPVTLKRQIGSAHVQELTDAIGEVATELERVAPRGTRDQTWQTAERVAELARVHGVTYREAALELARAAFASSDKFPFALLTIDPYAGSQTAKPRLSPLAEEHLAKAREREERDAGKEPEMLKPEDSAWLAAKLAERKATKKKPEGET